MVNQQAEIVKLFKEKVNRLTMGHSASIKAETAEKLLLSLQYVLNLGEQAARREGIVIGRESSLKALVDLGTKEAARQFEAAKANYEAVRRSRLDVAVLAYQDTIDHGFSAFFKSYNPELTAHESGCFVDYPLAEEDLSLTGAAYVADYLAKLDFENRFCAQFGASEIRQLLSIADREGLLNTREDLYSLFEMTYRQAVAVAVISGASGLQLTVLQAELLSNRWTNQSMTEMEVDLSEGHAKVVSGMFKDPSVSSLADWEAGYLERARERLAERLKSLKTESRGFESLIISDRPGGGAAQTLIGKRLNDEQWRSVYQKVLKASGTEEKLKLIREEISSLEDFTDLLKSDCFYTEEEYRQVFDLLTDFETGALTELLRTKELTEDWEKTFTRLKK